MRLVTDENWLNARRAVIARAMMIHGVIRGRGALPLPDPFGRFWLLGLSGIAFHLRIQGCE